MGRGGRGEGREQYKRLATDRRKQRGAGRAARCDVRPPPKAGRMDPMGGGNAFQEDCSCKTIPTLWRARLLAGPDGLIPGRRAKGSEAFDHPTPTTIETRGTQPPTPPPSHNRGPRYAGQSSTNSGQWGRLDSLYILLPGSTGNRPPPPLPPPAQCRAR